MFADNSRATNVKTRFCLDNLVGGWGGESFVKPPTGRSFRFVRACERARQGEAAWTSERRFDSGARAPPRVRIFHAGEVVRELSASFRLKTNGFSIFSASIIVKPLKKNIFNGQPCKTNVKTTCFADNLIKPTLFQ